MRVLLACAAGQVGFGLRGVGREVSGWRGRAAAIADPTARCLVLNDLRAKRSYLDGAAFFATLAPRRRRELRRLLVALQCLANHVDAVSERDGDPSRRWASMIVDAVDLDRTPDLARYARLPEGRYLAALIAACRDACRELPHYATVREQIAREARHGVTLDLEHDACPARRVNALRRFVAHELEPRDDLRWWELAAGTGSLLTLCAALTVAASDRRPRPGEATAVVDAYRAVASLSALLDNYADQLADHATGNNNYILMFGDGAGDVERLGDLVEHALRSVAALPDANRHVLLVAMMIAMFLSSDEARQDVLRDDTRRLLARSGTTTRLLVPALRAWRITHRQPAD